MNPQRRPARPASRSFAVDPPTLAQFLLLSMLLHVLLIVLFGNPPGGSARRGDGWLAPLDVTLQQLSSGSGLKPAADADTNAPGVSLRRRSAGAPAPAQALPRLNPTAPEEVDKPLTSPEVSPAKIERIAPARIERELAPALVVPPRAVPIAPAAPLERVTPPQIERDIAPPVELVPRSIPMAPAAPIERVAPPQIERDIAPPVELAPRAVPIAPAAPIERVAPPQIERDIAPPVEVPTPRAVPRSVPSDTVSPAERTAPSAAPARPQAAPVAPLAPSRLGTPDADEEIFKPRRDVGAPPSEAPRIDLDAARKKAAREIVSEGAGSRGVFSIPSPPPPEKKSKEAMAMEKAIKPDCRTAYADLGLLAVPVLVASAVSADGSCRW